MPCSRWWHFPTIPCITTTPAHLLPHWEEASSYAKTISGQEHLRYIYGSRRDVLPERMAHVLGVLTVLEPQKVKRVAENSVYKGRSVFFAGTPYQFTVANKDFPLPKQKRGETAPAPPRTVPANEMEPVPPNEEREEKPKYSRYPLLPASAPASESNGFFARRKQRKQRKVQQREQEEQFLAETVQRHTAVLEEYGAVYADVLQLADMPLLTSGSFCEQTRRFETALINAQDARKFTDPQRRRDAVVELEVAWRNAKDYASTVGRNTLDEKTLSTIEKARGLLGIAADHSQNEVYRRTCAMRALDLLKRNMVVPEAAEKRLFDQLKLQITAS